MQQTETERKFLVRNDSYKTSATKGINMKQGYICRESGRTVRVRIAGKNAWLTIKGHGTSDGTSRYEWEQEIPLEEAENLIKLCTSGIIDKTRYIVPSGKHCFEVDEFHEKNSGLTVAEIELENKAEPFIIPEWLGKEVTGDCRYYNSMLVSHPFSEWEKHSID